MDQLGEVWHTNSKSKEDLWSMYEGDSLIFDIISIGYTAVGSDAPTNLELKKK